MGLRKVLAVAMTAGMMLSFVPSTAFAASTGWQGNDSDGWRYYTSDSDYVKGDWKQIGGKWYYFNDSGYMATGWLQDGGKWYYLRTNGSMIANSWEVIGGKLYFFNQSGVMETNKWIVCGTFDVIGQEKEFYDYSSSYNKAEIDKYIGQKLWRYVGSDGAAYVGWQKVGGQWYHFNNYNLSGNLTEQADVSINHWASYAIMTYRDYYDQDEEAMYYFDENGIYLKNCWHKDCWNDWYYFEPNGHAASGWKQIGGKWYLFAGNHDDGNAYAMNQGFYEDYSNCTSDKDGYCDNYFIYYLKESGEMATGWIKCGDNWYYAESNGKLYLSRWFYSGGKWYYFGRLGKMAQNATNYEIDGKGYDFDSTGACLNHDSGRRITGWYKRIYDDASRYYYDHENGKYDWSYFDEAGNKVVDKTLYQIDGYFYDFDKHGVCKNAYEPYDILVPVG